MKSKKWVIPFLVALCYCQASAGYGLDTNGYDRIAHVGQKTVTVPLSDDFNNCPDGSALVSGKLTEDSVRSITFTRVGNLINITLGSGNPFENLAWTQEYPGPLSISFIGTEFESWITNGGNQVVLGVPGSYGDVTSSSPAIVQIYPGELVIFPTSGTYQWTGVTEDGVPINLDSQAWYEQQWPAGLNAIPVFSLTYPNADECRK